MRCLVLVGAAVWLSSFAGPGMMGAEPSPQSLTMQVRRRVAPQEGQDPRWLQVQKTVEWDPRHTALIVCDMWDDHWCRGAARRVAELAVPMNRLIHHLRDQGVFVLHCPSTTVDFYQGTPQRKRAQDAPYARPPVALATSTRWGTAWCWPDKDREPELPIDDSDMGCDCPGQKCEIREAWTRQIETIDIEPPDAISDNGQEVYNLLQQQGIEHVLILGVHLNMCVLGRPFAIRQLKHLGQDVVLLRDMTDTMYNSQRKPFVNHFQGTDLVIEHVEKYWCPTTTSADLVGGEPFRFQQDKR